MTTTWLHLGFSAASGRHVGGGHDIDTLKSTLNSAVVAGGDAPTIAAWALLQAALAYDVVISIDSTLQPSISTLRQIFNRALEQAQGAGLT